MYRSIICAICAFAQISFAHEMTPTYPEFKPAVMDGIYKTNIQMFNHRDDVQWFEVGVYDAEWNDVSHVSTSGILKVEYLRRASVDIFVTEKDLERVVYICSTSMLDGSTTNNKAFMASKICSKVKH